MKTLNRSIPLAGLALALIVILSLAACVPLTATPPVQGPGQASTPPATQPVATRSPTEPAAQPTSAPATAEPTPGKGGTVALLLSWHREGGIAGFCDDLIITAGNEVVATSCKANQGKELMRRQLTPQETDKLQGWIKALQPFEINQTDPATADAMTTRMQFAGQGTAAAGEPERQAILGFVVQLYAEATQ